MSLLAEASERAEELATQVLNGNRGHVVHTLIEDDSKFGRLVYACLFHRLDAEEGARLIRVLDQEMPE